MRDSQPAWLIHVCVFDTAPPLRASPPATDTQPTPTASPVPAHARIVATDIRVLTRAQEPARILGGWSDSGRAELMTHGLTFYTPALRESEVLRYAIEIETREPTDTWRVQVSHAMGPAIDLSSDPTLRCDSSGLFITALPRDAQAENASPPTLGETVGAVVAMVFRDRAAAPPRGPAFSAGHTQNIIVIIAGIAGLACLIAAVCVWRRLPRNRGQLPR